VKLNDSELRVWADARQGALRALWRAKFTQDPLCRRVLLVTLDAALLHSPGRAPAEHWRDLEELRQDIRGGPVAPDGDADVRAEDA
jgi:hypothetical protein